MFLKMFVYFNFIRYLKYGEGTNLISMYCER